MEFKYVVSYNYGEVGNTVGCHTFNQAKEIAEAIAIYVTKAIGEQAEIIIINTELDYHTKYYY